MDIPEEWLTGDDSQKAYSEEKFYIGATDSHGHSAKLQVKLKESEAAMIAPWITHPVTPYRSMQDFIRDAVHHRLHALHVLVDGGKLTDGLQEALILGALNTYRVQREARDEMMKTLNTETHALIASGEYDRAEDHLDELLPVIDYWPPTQRRQSSTLIIQLLGSVRQARDAARLR